MSTDTEPDTETFGYNDPAYDESGPAWQSDYGDEGPNYHRNDRPVDPWGDPGDDEEDLDEQVERAHAEQFGSTPNHPAPTGPGSFLKWAVGGATVIVTALGTFVLVGPLAALVPIGAGAAAAATAAGRRRNANGGASRRRRMNNGGPGGGRTPRGGGGRGGRTPTFGGGGGRGRGGGAGGSRGAGGGGRGRGGPTPGAGGGRGRGGTGGPKPTSTPKGSGTGGRGGTGGPKPTSTPKTPGTGSNRRKAMQGTGTAPTGRIAKALGLGGGKGGGTGPTGGRHRAGGGGGSRGRGGAGGGRGRGRGGAGPQTNGAASGGTRGRGGRRGRKAPQGAGQGQVQPTRTMRQRAARVAGDFGRGLWAIPSYPARQAYRGARAGARRTWQSRPVRGARKAARKFGRRRIVRPLTAWYARRRKIARKRARQQRKFYRRTWWPRQGRRLMVPARWVRRHVLHDAAFYRRQYRRGMAATFRVGRTFRRVWARRLRRLAHRLRPNWWVQLRNFAAINGRGAAFLMALTAMMHGLGHFFRDVLPAWALHGRGPRRRRPPVATPAPTPAPAPAPAPAGPMPRGARPGTPAPTPAPARPAGPTPFMPTFPRPNATPAPATAGAAPASGGSTPMGNTTISVAIPGNLHPSLSKILEASYKCTATFQPKSGPDLHVYLESQPYMFKTYGDIYRTFSNRLAATFPRISLVHSFFLTVANGLDAQAGPAHELFRGWEILHPEDLARFRSPAVNERYADVNARHGVQVANVPVIGNGMKWHANHTVMMEVMRGALGGLQFGGHDEDKVRELLNWLDSLPLFFDCLCRHTLALGKWLVENKPIEHRFGDFYIPLARGYLGLADEAEQLADTYRNRAAGDVRRRERPRVDEQWFDFGNQAMTGA